jgi:hypothetical protein
MKKKSVRYSVLKLKLFCSMKDNMKGMKSHRLWEKYPNISDKGLVSKIYKQIYNKLSTKENKQH